VVVIAAPVPIIDTVRGVEDIVAGPQSGEEHHQHGKDHDDRHDHHVSLF
jgi:hypothetical protein